MADDLWKSPTITPGTGVIPINPAFGAMRGHPGDVSRGPMGARGQRRRIDPGQTAYEQGYWPQPPNEIADVDIDRNWFCYDAETEVLTAKRGWLRFADLADDDEVATLQPQTRTFEWQKPTHRPVYDYIGPMHRFESRAVDLLVTPGHRMLTDVLTRKAAKALGKSAKHEKGTFFVPAKTLAETLNHHVGIPLSADHWHAHDIPSLTFRLGDPREKPIKLKGGDYCAFLGLYLSEGSLHKPNGRPSAVYIWQSAKSQHLAAMKAILAKAFGARVSYRGSHGSRKDTGCFIIYSRALAVHLAQFGDDSSSKFIPLAVRNASRPQLEAFWSAYMLGDGEMVDCTAKVRKFRLTKRQRIGTASCKLADNLQEIAVKLGYSASIKVEDRQGLVGHAVNGNVIQSVVPVYRIGLRGARSGSTLRTRRENYRGKVYCVSVLNNTVYVRRNGKPCWSGNSPFQPVTPFGPPYTTWPRTYDYPVGENLQYVTPRAQLFEMLRAIAQSWGLVATIIQTRIDQLMRMPWTVRIKDEPDKQSRRVTEVMRLLEEPDGQDDFETWARMVLYDLLVIDAPSLYVRKSITGKPIEWWVLDGATIKPLIDDAGRRPRYPSPAYQQIIKGLPNVNLDEGEILYCRQRPRPQMPSFGYSPVEQIILEIMEGLRKQIYKVGFWNEGSLPDMIMSVPGDWRPEQIASFQSFFDGMLAGNLAQKSKVRFVPDGMKPFSVKNSAGEALHNEEDEWLARIACYAFSVPAQPFIRQMNRATAETAKQEASEEGLHPLMNWFSKRFMGTLIRHPRYGLGYTEIEFSFEAEKEVDPEKQMTVITGYVKAGVMMPNEGRGQIDLPPQPGGDELVVETANGPTPLKETIEANRQKALAVPDQIAQQKEAHDQQMGAGQQQLEQGQEAHDVQMQGQKQDMKLNAQAAKQPQGKLAKAYDPNEARDERGRWFHGTREALHDYKSNRPLYLTQALDQAWAYARGAHLGGTGDSAPHVKVFAMRPGKVLDINDHILRAFDKGEDADVGINQGMHEAKKTGARYLEYQHPNAVGGGDEHTVRISLFPSADLRHVKTYFKEVGKSAGLPFGKGRRAIAPVTHDRAKEAQAASRVGAVLGDAGAKVAAEYRAGGLLKAREPIQIDLAEVADALGLDEAAQDALANATVSIDPDAQVTDVVNQRAVEFAQEQAARLVVGIRKTTRDALRELIADGIAQGKNRNEIADDIAADFSFSQERADLIAATELSMANNGAALIAYKEARDQGLRVRKVWLIAPDACDECKDNADDPIELDDDFPSGDSNPPAHPNCRCAISVVVDGDEDEGEGDE